MQRKPVNYQASPESISLETSSKVIENSEIKVSSTLPTPTSPTPIDDVGDTTSGHAGPQTPAPPSQTPAPPSLPKRNTLQTPMQSSQSVGGPSPIQSVPSSIQSSGLHTKQPTNSSVQSSKSIPSSSNEQALKKAQNSYSSASLETSGSTTFHSGPGVAKRVNFFTTQKKLFPGDNYRNHNNVSLLDNSVIDDLVSTTGLSRNYNSNKEIRKHQRGATRNIDDACSIDSGKSTNKEESTSKFKQALQELDNLRKRNDVLEKMLEAAKTTAVPDLVESQAITNEPKDVEMKVVVTTNETEQNKNGDSSSIGAIWSDIEKCTIKIIEALGIVCDDKNQTPAAAADSPCSKSVRVSQEIKAAPKSDVPEKAQEIKAAPKSDVPEKAQEIKAAPKQVLKRKVVPNQDIPSQEAPKPVISTKVVPEKAPINEVEEIKSFKDAKEPATVVELKKNLDAIANPLPRKVTDVPTSPTPNIKMEKPIPAVPTLTKNDLESLNRKADSLLATINEIKKDVPKTTQPVPVLTASSSIIEAERPSVLSNVSTLGSSQISLDLNFNKSDGFETGIMDSFEKDLMSIMDDFKF